MAFDLEILNEQNEIVSSCCIGWLIKKLNYETNSKPKKVIYLLEYCDEQIERLQPYVDKYNIF
jgi:hypothetical protein